ncbi:MAG: hypothetical protein ABR591_01325 [Candidatus Velthaea sp.]
MATREIVDVVNTMQHAADKAVAAIGDIAATVTDIQAIATQVSTAIAQQTDSTRDISVSVRQRRWAPPMSAPR